MNKDNINIIFKDDYAYTQNEIYEKKEILRELKTLKNEVSKVIIRKKETEKSIFYNLTFDKEIINIIIPKKYQKQNEQYINILNKWYNISRKQSIRKLKALAITVAISSCGIAAFHKPLKEAFNNVTEYFSDLFTDEVGDLEREILIHSGHYNEPDGHSVSAHYDHGCVFIDDKSIPVADRIKLYCEEHNLQYLEESALQQYEYLYNDNVKLGNKINLKQIEKEHKQKVKNSQ